MKKLNKILAVASAVMLSTCAGGKTQAQVVSNEKGVPVELKYSSEAPSFDEIFQDMQTLENYVDEQRKKIPFEYQSFITKHCLVSAAFANIDQNDGQSSKQECQKAIIIDWVQDGFIGDYLYWAKYLNYLLNTAGITSHVLHIKHGQSNGSLSDVGHAVVVYKLKKEETKKKVTHTPWMVLTCGANFYGCKSPDLTLIQYAKDYLNCSKGKFLQLKVETECDPQQRREINLNADHINKLTEPMMCAFVQHLLTPPGEETILSRVLKLHATGKNQKK